MSAEASRRMRLIKALLAHAESSDPRARHFYAGLTGADFEELAALGLLNKVLGTPRGFAWCLTDAGVQHIRELPLDGN
ncbi:MAG TPA: hypothetical protein VHW01_02655 [Polyangiaceae bacterium]|jgi:hypothetical protein|nr:hypothetical protein [Polyangiaceae bacterium]